MNPELGPSARVALELNIASGKALLAQLQAVIEAAGQSGFPEELQNGGIQSQVA